MVSAVMSAKPTARRSILASSRPPRAESRNTPATSATMPAQPMRLNFSPMKIVVAVAVISGAEPRDRIDLPEIACAIGLDQRGEIKQVNDHRDDQPWPGGRSRNTYQRQE